MSGWFARAVVVATMFAAVGVAASGCSSANDTTTTEGVAEADLSGQPQRDWKAHPAILEIDDADEIYALSDIHGAYAEFGRLLEANGIISNFSMDPSRAGSARWTGGTKTLVMAGDAIDKGAESIGVIDLLRSLEAKAAAAGGRVVVTMGNHEAEFLADPMNDKALATTEDGSGISVQLEQRGLKPKDVARGRDPEGRGAWLLNLPFGVRIKKWFFSHGGNTNGESIEDLAKRLRKAVDQDGYGAGDITGSHSILEDQNWYGDPNEGRKATRYADALGVKHLVFGHDPGALDDRGRIIAAGDKALLVKLNVNMGLAHTSNSVVGGALLHIRTRGTDTAEVLDASGMQTPIL